MFYIPIDQILFFSYLILFFLSFIFSHFLCCFFFHVERLDKFQNIFSKGRAALHSYTIPRLGGVIIFFSIIASILVLFSVSPDSLLLLDKNIAPIFLGALMLFLVGAADDITPISYKVKFVFQVIAASILIIYGLKIGRLTIPFGMDLELGWAGNVFLIVWVVAITNAINILDGLDGLASGIVFLIALGIFAITFKEKPQLAIIAITIIGSVLAFLRFNFYPAKLFLGDSGSLLFGFLVAALSIAGSFKRSTFLSISIPILILILPFGSIAFTFLRRLIDSKNPFKPDLKHLHYRLLDANFSHTMVVFLFCLATLIFVTIGVACYYLPNKYEIKLIIISLCMLLLFYLATAILIRKRTNK